MKRRSQNVKDPYKCIVCSLNWSCVSRGSGTDFINKVWFSMGFRYSDLLMIVNLIFFGGVGGDIFDWNHGVAGRDVRLAFGHKMPVVN